jgi:hypothetical protein
MVFLDDTRPAFLDDIAGAAPQADPEADARWASLTPDQRLDFALDFQGRAERLATFAIRHGQTRAGFLASMAAFWDQRAAYVRTVSQAIAPAPAPPAPPEPETVG